MPPLAPASRSSAEPLGPEASADAVRPPFAVLYDEHFAFVWRSALRLGAGQEHVDDVVQETFLVAHERLRSFEGRSSVKTWLFGILVNVLRAYRRRAAPRGNLHGRADPESLADPAAGPLESLSQAEAARFVDRLLDSLDEDKRAVFVLADLEQMSAPEIANALQIPMNTVYSRLRLARQEFAAAAARHRARDEWRIR